MTAVIDRSFIGKKYPPFIVEISESFCRDFNRLLNVQGPDELSPDRPPLNWPALMTLHGTACLLTLWEDLGVDPLEARLAGERFIHHRPVKCGEPLFGSLTIDDLTEQVTPVGQIDDRIALHVDFRDASDAVVATYHCAFHIALAGPG
jgi:hypothetical protein